MWEKEQVLLNSRKGKVDNTAKENVSGQSS